MATALSLRAVRMWEGRGRPSDRPIPAHALAWGAALKGTRRPESNLRIEAFSGQDELSVKAALRTSL